MSAGGFYLWTDDAMQAGWRQLAQVADEAEAFGLDVSASELRTLAASVPDLDRLAAIIPPLRHHPALSIMAIGYGDNLGPSDEFWAEALAEAIGPSVVQETWT